MEIIFLLWVLAPALWWHVYSGAFEQFEQGLLHTFTGNISCDARVVVFACDFIHLVDEYDPHLGALNVVVCGL